jgi:putative acetyltransferase
MLPEVPPLRHASRELVRELGFLQSRETGAMLPHSHCHALIEIEARGRVAQAELAPLLRLDKSTTSRIVAELESRAWVRAQQSSEDGRARVLSLTAKGRAKLEVVHQEANARVEDALRLLGEQDRSTVVRGMQIYTRALERARRRAEYAIAPISPRDREAVARLIRTVMPEFGASGGGFAILDPEVDDMFGAYQASERAAYWVVTHDGRVVGGGGFARLAGGDDATCELRKMYFLSEVRGLGIGQELLEKCLQGACEAGFERMYLETLGAMTQARALYERNGFVRLEGPLGNTGHFGCNAFYARALSENGPAARLTAFDHGGKRGARPSRSHPNSRDDRRGAGR